MKASGGRKNNDRNISKLRKSLAKMYGMRHPPTKTEPVRTLTHFLFHIELISSSGASLHAAGCVRIQILKGTVEMRGKVLIITEQTRHAMASPGLGK